MTSALDFTARVFPKMVSGGRVLVLLPGGSVGSMTDLEVWENFRSRVPVFQNGDTISLVSDKKPVVPVNPIEQGKVFFGPDLRESDRHGVKWTVQWFTYLSTGDRWFVSLKEFSRNDCSLFPAEHFKIAEPDQPGTLELTTA